jgi:hypothetical protein
LAKPTGPAKFFDGHARVSLFEEANDLHIGKSGLFHSRYSPKLANFVPSLWYGREGAGQGFKTRVHSDMTCFWLGICAKASWPMKSVRLKTLTEIGSIFNSGKN